MNVAGSISKGVVGMCSTGCPARDVLSRRAGELVSCTQDEPISSGLYDTPIYLAAYRRGERYG